MVTVVENEAQALALNPHLYELQAVREGVRLFREVTPADLSMHSDETVLRMIRATCGDGGHRAHIAEQIDADHKAILRALNALGKPLREVSAGDAH